MCRRVLTLLTLLVALWLVTLALPAAASARGAHGGQPPVLLAAGLRGANEVPGPGDPDGRARALVRLDGDQVCFALFWKGLDPVIAAHIHKGRRGEAGPIVIGFFATSADLATAPGLPAELHAVAGCTTGDPATVADVRAHPRDYYVNIHTTVYRAGAVRGQLHRFHGSGAPIDGLLGRSTSDSLLALMSGGQEVPGPGDPDGAGVALVNLRGNNRVCFALAWDGLDPVIASHIHRGGRGEAGPIVIGFFATSADLATAPGLPAELHAVAGCTTGDPDTVADVRAHPRDYYVNIHTTVYRAGAVRGQLHRLV